jgi:hypothetical protein
MRRSTQPTPWIWKPLAPRRSGRALSHMDELDVLIPAIAVAPLLTGVLLVVLARREITLAWQSRRWPHTTGRICDILVREGVAPGMTTDGTGAPTLGTFREVELMFSYPVSGRWYQSSRYSFAASGWQANTQRYDEGDEVTVYYCPSDPSMSVLRPGLIGGLWGGPFFLAVGVAVLAYYAWCML